MLDKAKDFAIRWHGEQKRKYTGAPYWHHLEEVAVILRMVDLPEYVQIAGWLHDVLEDTKCTPEYIETAFGSDVLRLVWEVTDQSKPEDGNRATRKAIDRMHLLRASALGQSIKLADLISNTQSIVKYDPNFARVYLREKEELLKVLLFGSDTLRSWAWHTLRESQRRLSSLSSLASEG